MAALLGAGVICGCNETVFMVTVKIQDRRESTSSP